MDVTRREIVEKLYNKGLSPTFSPLDNSYSYQVEMILTNKFVKDSDLTKKKELEIRNSKKSQIACLMA